ncbi:hypothetical protein Dimus_025433 [Dionaea muscipula]
MARMSLGRAALMGEVVGMRRVWVPSCLPLGASSSLEHGMCFLLGLGYGFPERLCCSLCVREAVEGFMGFIGGRFMVWTALERVLLLGEMVGLEAFETRVLCAPISFFFFFCCLADYAFEELFFHLVARWL